MPQSWIVSDSRMWPANEGLPIMGGKIEKKVQKAIAAEWSLAWSRIPFRTA